MSQPSPQRISIALLCAVFAGNQAGQFNRVNDLLHSDSESNDALLYEPENEEHELGMEIE